MYFYAKLDEETKIKQINIENESSAFVEVLVKNSNIKGVDDFDVILSVTSFMSPSECKSNTNGNRLKLFTEETSLFRDRANMKWDTVKIVCTQPFNKVRFEECISFNNLSVLLKNNITIF